MLKQVISVFVGAAVWAATAAGEAKPKTELLGTVEFASFDEVQQKMAELGATINNPVVPMLTMPTLQSFLNENCGKFRKDAPMTLYCYAQIETLRKAMSGDPEAADVDDAIEPVFVYPTAEDQAAFVASHPEAQKAADGSIKLDDETVVVYAADGRTCAFAKNVDSAKRALAVVPASAAKRPLMRVNMTEPAFALLADFQLKVGEDSMKQMQRLDSTNVTEKAMAALVKLQQDQLKKQSEAIRAFGKGCMTVDFDDTGFVVKASATAKSGASVPASGFRLPSGVLDGVPAGAPLFLAMNPYEYSNCYTEKDWCEYIDVMKSLTDVLFECASKDTSNTKHAPMVEGLRTAVNDIFVSMKSEYTPSAWCVGAFAFGPKQEPYFVQNGMDKSATKSISDLSRFFAALTAAIDKSWPGILRADGASLAIDLAKLMDTAAAESGVKGEAQKELANAKKKVADILGANKIVFASKATSATTWNSCVTPAGFIVPPAKPYGEARFAAALPEAAKERPSGAFYLSLYSMIRDNILPIVLKVTPKEEAQQIRPILAVLPAAGANSAIAGAGWSDKGGSLRFLLRITSDEIRNFGAAANAVMAVNAAKGGGDVDDDDK